MTDDINNNKDFLKKNIAARFVSGCSNSAAANYGSIQLFYRYVLTASTSITTQVEDINGEEVTIHGRHAYSIKSVDKDAVTVVNPWNSSKEIVISRETFFESFSSIASTDLS